MSASAQAVVNETDGVTPRPTLLCVDDEPNILSALRRLFRRSGYKIVVAEGGQDGLAVFAQESVNVVISDMRMPEMTGAEFLKAVAEQWPDTVRILLTGYSDIESTISAVNDAGLYRYVAKPWDENDLRMTVASAVEQQQLKAERKRLEALTEKQNAQLRELNANLEQKVEERSANLKKAVVMLRGVNGQLKRSYQDTAEIFSQLIKLRESHSHAHSRQVALLSRDIAQQMGVKDRDLDDVYFAALLHDLGKIALPEQIVRLRHYERSSEQRREMREHPVLGAAALTSLPVLDSTARLIRSHHEYFDGSGYPDKLTGEAIPLGSRIIAVANEYDHLRSGQMEPEKVDQKVASDWIKQRAGKRYDPKVVKAFLQVLPNHDNATDSLAEKVTATSALASGMVLSRDLKNHRGILLVRAGETVNQRLIEKIRLLEADAENSFSISVYDPEVKP